MQPFAMRALAGLALLIGSSLAGHAAEPPPGTVRYASFEAAFDGFHLASGMDVPIGGRASLSGSAPAAASPASAWTPRSRSISPRSPARRG